MPGRRETWVQLDRFAGKVVVITGGASVDLKLVCPRYIDTNLFATGSFAGSLKADQLRERIPFRLIDVDTAVARMLEAVLKARAGALNPAARPARTEGP